VTLKYTDYALAKQFDRLLVTFQDDDVVMVKSEGRTTKAMRLMFGPYVVKQQQGQGYILANKDGTPPSTFKGKPVRVELLGLVHRATDPPLANEM
ncbi:hypothetical protein SARC_11787, partial [Sphaeroforma arctica JP610]